MLAVRRASSVSTPTVEALEKETDSLKVCNATFIILHLHVIISRFCGGGDSNIRKPVQILRLTRHNKNGILKALRISLQFPCHAEEAYVGRNMSMME